MHAIKLKSQYENMKIIYNRSKLGWYWSPLFFTFWFLLFYLIVIPNFHRYPETLTIENESKYPESFIGERAENFLLKLSKIGPKVVGSAANEQVAVQFLLNEINKIQKEARTDLYRIETDVQISSGNYFIKGLVNSYQSIQNIVVKLTPRNTTSTSTLLLNSHYDTVPGSSGAGDAGIMIAVIMEVFRVIVKNDTPLKHSLVFLLNGAEENALQGSHAFITQHKWAKNIKAVINLDSAGAGGREILFQSGPDNPWLFKYYAESTLYPYANTVGEEMFQKGFVPSDTDFRIFRDFGNIPGLDMAHTLNGYVYHTKFDRFNQIPRKSYQLTGDNILALTKALANAPEMEDPLNHAEGHYIFFDVLGWFLVSYSEEAGTIINICVCIVSIITILAYIWNMAHQTGMFRRRVFAKFGILLAVQLAAVAFALLITITICFTLDIAGLSLSWFSKTWFIFGLYFCPMFFGLGILPATYLSRTKEHGLPLAYGIQLLMHAHCLILTLMCILLISLGIRSAFIFIIAIFFYTISVILNIITCFHKKTFLWLIPHVLCQLFPYLFYTYFCYAFYIAFVPMQGRDGPNSHPEVLIAGFTALLCLLFSTFLIPLLCIFRKSKTIISLFGVICVIFVILAATPVGFPYKEKEATQRFHVMHTTRAFHDGDAKMSIRRSDSGFFVIPMDRRRSTINYLFENGNFNKTENDDCNNELACGFPLFSPRWLGWGENYFWIPGPEPLNDGWPKIKIISKQSTSSTNILFTLELSGPDHMGMFIRAHEDAKLIDWSFTKEALKWDNKSKTYFINFAYALDPTPLKFYIEFQHNSTSWSGNTFDIAIIGHKLHNDIVNTDEFREFLSKFPTWAHLSAWTSSFESFRF